MRQRCTVCSGKYPEQQIKDNVCHECRGDWSHKEEKS